MQKTGKKVLKKIKGGAWIAVALIGSLTFAPLAEVAAVTENSAVTLITDSHLASDFEGKHQALDDEQVQAELEQALSQITVSWEENSVEEVRAEIERQTEAGLDVYIVQWGDTLSVIAQALEVELADLAEANNLEDEDLIFVGDILTYGDLLTRDSTPPTVPSEDSTDEGDAQPPVTEQPTDPEIGGGDDDKGDDDKETPTDPEQPTDPENPTDPEEPGEPDPEITEEVIQEHEVQETRTEIISEAEIPGEEGQTGEETTPGEVVSLGSETITEEVIIPGEDTVDIVTEEVTVLDEEGNPVLDENGNPVFETVEREVVIPGEDIIQTTTTTTETIQHGMDLTTIYDNTLDVGTEIVESEGQDGLVQHTTVDVDQDGVLVDSSSSETRLQEKINRVVRVGTKQPSSILQTVVETIPITHGIIQRTDPRLYEDYSEVTEQGQDGYTATTYEVILDLEGKEVSRTEVDSEVIEPVYEVITVGSKPIHDTQTETVEEKITFETETRENPELAEGETRVIQEGQNGVKAVTYTIYTEKGVEVRREVASEEIVTAPVTEIVEVGTLTEEPTDPVEEIERRTEVETIPFETERVLNEDLPANTEVIVTEGQNGQVTIVYEDVYVDGELISSTEVSREVSTPPVTQVSEYGPGAEEPGEVIETRTETEPVPFETEERENPDLAAGERHVIQSGVDGEETVTYEDIYIDGELVETREVSREVTTVPVTEIIEVGTLAETPGEDTDASTYHQVDYDIVNAELPSDQVVIDESTLTNNNYVDMTPYYNELVIQGEIPYELMDNELFRDATTSANLMLVGTDGSVMAILPGNINSDLLLYFTASDLIDTLAYDIQFKSDHVFNYQLTNDLYESNELFKTFTPAMLADVKANKARAEMIIATGNLSGDELTAAEESLAYLKAQYDNFVDRYNSANTNGATVEVVYDEAVTPTPATQGTINNVNIALEAIPDALRALMHTINIVPAAEMIEGNPDFEIAAYANHNFELFFADAYQATLGLVYHEIGHLVDYSTILYQDASQFENGYTSLSATQEWRAVFEEEWNQEGSYFATEVESFGQAFGAFALDRYHDRTMDQEGYAGFGLDGRPLTVTFFDTVFTALGY